jgi:hypothetical protein
MPADDSIVAFAYSLTADNTQFGFMRSASFPTASSLVFESSLGMSKPFLDSLKRKGHMPFNQWTLIVLDTALREVLRYNWGPTRVTRIRFPSVENQSIKPLRCSIECAVTGVQQASPNAGAGASGSVNGAQAQPAGVTFVIQSKIDGLEAAEWSVSKIGALDLRCDVPGDLVLTATPEKSADPFRSWLSGGNSPRAGTVNCLNTALQTFLSLRFAGLRVRTVTPAFTTDSPGPATIRLSYSSISF